ncbi:COX15/CtaA family protein [Actinokineospora fastidiosa]|uniref:Cytochrome-c oxidase n=1 Tax=Actinokineospora fastidiosa TaxID=1816 RepID=A0A918GHL7_9PSEU|nr:COX15/CtaA family protein [Actinokineospora fastidiosa]GGS33179.1 cytochrome-c oxidase [Actinokineospora fastidiosa]
MSLKTRLDTVRPLSRRTQRSLAWAVVVTQALIAVTGSIVRVTGSGLACTTWPECHPGSMVPTEHPEYADLNQWIEFGNRLFTGVVGLIAFAAFAAAYLDRPRRSRYVRLALIMPIGVAVQAVIGGITVRFDLLWWTVAVHFMASAVMVWLAVLLVYAVDEQDGPPRPVGPPVLGRTLQAMAALLVALLIAGTFVTGAGPHAGDALTPRLDVELETMAHVHAAFLYAFLGLLVAVGLMLRRVGSRRLWRHYIVLVAVVLAQGALGFTQFALGVPELLVALHVLGAMAVIVAAAALWSAAHPRERA